jgi:uncharacterized membrane protein HdeD (DUF308 family)
VIEGLKTRWRELRQGEPGRRFRARYERRHSRRRHAGGRKWSVMVAGAVIVLAGIVLLPLPGPGMLVIALGALLVAEESLTVAKMLDALELRGRALISRWRPAASTRSGSP